MLLGAMQGPKPAGVNLAGQGIQQEEFMTVPSARPEYGSRQLVSKISSSDRGQVMA